MTKNAIIETLSKAIADKYESRAVADFHGEHEGETMLIDFTGCGEPFEADIICTWSLQKDMDEEDWGQFTSYSELFDFLYETFNGKEVELYVESF